MFELLSRRPFERVYELVKGEACPFGRPVMSVSEETATRPMHATACMGSTHGKQVPAMRRYTLTSWSGSSVSLTATTAALAARVLVGPGSTCTASGVVLDVFGEPWGRWERVAS